MHSFRIFLLFLLFLNTVFSCLNSALAQKKTFLKAKKELKPKPIPTLKPEQLRQDFQLFRKSLEEAHPDLYAYNSATSFNAAFDSVSALLVRPLTEQEFFKILQPLISRIHSRNTKLKTGKRTSNQYPFLKDQLFPVEVYFHNGKAYALNSFSDSAAVPFNAEIKAINGRKMEAVVKDLMPYVSAADGQITAAKYQHLGNNFSIYLAAFSDAKPVYEISFQLESQLKTVAVKDANLERWQQVKSREAAFRKILPWSLEFGEKKVAVLTISTFDETLLQPDYKLFIAEAFRQIKASEVNQLIIDLRDNGTGESEAGALLYSYLTPEPFSWYRSINTNTNKRFSFMKYGEVPWNFFFYRRLLKTNPNGTFRYTYHSNLKEQKPKPNAFGGEVFILQNTETANAAAEFAAIAQSNNRATVAGQETGSTFGSFSGGKSVKVTLPNSKFELTIPLWRISLAVDEKLASDKGIQPVFPVSPTSEDLQTGYDREMQYLLNLIRKKNGTVENKLGE